VRRVPQLEGAISVYLLTLADSGERKTTADNFFSTAIRAYEAQQAEDADPEVKRYDAAIAAWAAEKEGILMAVRAAAKAAQSTEALRLDLFALENNKPKAPRVPRLLRLDDTPEKLAWVLAKEWPAAAILSSEAAIVFGGHAMGKESVMRNLGQLNVLWERGILPIGRRTTESFTVKGARLTLALQIQESVLRRFIDQTGGMARGIGFLARFLLAWPESTQGFRPFSDPPKSWPKLAEFNQRMSDILKIPAPIDEQGTLTPTMLSLSPAAKHAWVEYHDMIEGQLRAGGELYDVRDAASKSADNAARLAALFQAFAWGGRRG
jgi:putative DNA primase/helicase